VLACIDHYLQFINSAAIGRPGQTPPPMCISPPSQRAASARNSARLSVDSIRMYQAEAYSYLAGYVLATSIGGPILALIGWKVTELILD
jgi:hypothetical protein